MTRPTPEQLQRVIDVVAAGLDLEDAIESVWENDTHDDDGNQLTPAEVPEPPAPKPLTQMVTEFPDGVVIGWDTCNRNGGCGKHVKKCACKNGPKEPDVFAKWRNEGSHPGQGALKPASSVSSAPTTPVATKAPGKLAVHPDGQVVCREHNDFVDQSEADKNDDGTWTCFNCQEAGVQVKRD